MRVLIYTNMFPFPGRPFYGSFVKDEAEALSGAGCDVDVLFINGLQNKLSYLASPFRFARTLRRQKYDVVHVHHSFCGAVAVLQKRIPVVWTFHEGEISGGPESRRRDRPLKLLAHSRRFKRWVASRVDALVVVADHLRGPLGRPDAVTIPAGMDLDLFAPGDRSRARRELGLSTEKKYVLFPSSPARVEKRFELAREAVARARTALGEVELLALDNVAHEQVPLYMNAADVLLMTSSFEASPVTVREALACNLPVVSTDVGDVRVWLSGAPGCFVVGPDPEEIARALENVLREPRRTEGRGIVEAHSLARTARRIIAVYESVRRI